MNKVLQLNDFLCDTNNAQTFDVRENSCLPYIKESKIEHEGACGRIEKIVSDDISLVYTQLKVQNPVEMSYTHNSNPDTLKMFFALRGSSSIQLDGFSGELAFECNQYNLFYSPHKSFETYIGKLCKGCNSCKEWHFLEISIKASYFEKYLVSDNVALLHFKESLQNKRSSIFCPNNLNITVEIHDILQRILLCVHEGIHRRLFIEAKILELISLEIAQLEDYKCPALTSLKRTDIDKIYKAREILLCSKDTPCPITELALKVGTNECTLKKGFKEVFGSTVYGYLHEVRMQDAHTSLLKTEKTIAEIADEIGYKNATHFTTAFKRKYGIVPSKLRLQRT